MKAYVINLDRRPERWDHAQQQWSKYFELVRVPAIELPLRRMGCKLSHLVAANMALAGDHSAVIMEDDAQPLQAFHEIGMDCIRAAMEMPTWDYVNLGPFLDLSKTIFRRAARLSACDSPLFFQSDYSHQTHLVMYNKSSLPLLGSAIESKLPLDMHLGTVAKMQWVPRRLLTTQAGFESDITSHCPVNVNECYVLSMDLLAASCRLLDKKVKT